ncbi:MAG: hypothetical protein ACK5P5_09455 [Pseudobdellovibrionaceae bacterium]
MKKNLLVILSLTLSSIIAKADLTTYTCGSGNDYQQISITKTNQGNDGEKVSVSSDGREIKNVKEVSEIPSEYQESIDLKLVLNNYETIRILTCEKNK